MPVELEFISHCKYSTIHNALCITHCTKIKFDIPFMGNIQHLSPSTIKFDIPFMGNIQHLSPSTIAVDH